MVKKPVVIRARAGLRDPAPSRPHVIISIGNQRYKIEINTKITFLPNRAAEVIPIDRNLKGEK
jgi:hypothetical protein